LSHMTTMWTKGSHSSRHASIGRCCLRRTAQTQPLEPTAPVFKLPAALPVQRRVLNWEAIVASFRVISQYWPEELRKTTKVLRIVGTPAEIRAMNPRKGSQLSCLVVLSHIKRGIVKTSLVIVYLSS
jgi:hypothetical protein